MHKFFSIQLLYSKSPLNVHCVLAIVMDMCTQVPFISQTFKRHYDWSTWESFFFLLVAGKLFRCRFKLTCKWCKFTFFDVKLKGSHEIGWASINIRLPRGKFRKHIYSLKKSMWDVQLDCSLRMTACTSSGLKRWKLGFTLAMSTFAGVNCKKKHAETKALDEKYTLSTQVGLLGQFDFT
jgi:hypothetical protein